MNYKGVLKRLLPFAATFAVAVFITSFFVDLHRPGRFGEWRQRAWERRSGFERMMRENEELRTENEAVKNENLRLKNDIENRRIDSMSTDDLKTIVRVPLAPTAPVRPMPMKLRHSGE